MSKQKPYTLVGVDGNAYALMGYTQDAMEHAGYTSEDIDGMIDDAESSNYQHLIAVCNSWIHRVNKKLGLN